MTRNLINTIFKYIIVFTATFFVSVGLLAAVNLIPGSAIENGIRESADYLSANESFPLIIGDMVNSKADNYADTELLNVICNVNSDSPVYSLIVNPYYRIKGNDTREDFKKAAYEHAEPNSNYSRYWHGSAVLVRPLLTFASIRDIRIILFGAFILLNIILGIILIKAKARLLPVVYTISLLSVHPWMLAFSVEYIISFIIMTVTAIMAVLISNKGKMVNQRIGYLFICAGTVTCFMDFLTTETLTFTIPVIMLVMLRKHDNTLNSFKEEIIQIFKWGLCWSAGYAAMFAIKWGLVYAYGGKAAFDSIIINAAYRIDGAVTVDGLGLGEVATPFQRIFFLLVRNLSCLYPVSSNVTVPFVLLSTLGILLVLGAVLYLFRKDEVDWAFIGIICLMGFIPYIRYLVLSNHAYIHYFFTYRAQMASVMGVLAVLFYTIEPAYFTAKSKKKKRKRLYGK